MRSYVGLLHEVLVGRIAARVPPKEVKLLLQFLAAVMAGVIAWKRTCELTFKSQLPSFP